MLPRTFIEWLLWLTITGLFFISSLLAHDSLFPAWTEALREVGFTRLNVSLLVMIVSWVYFMIRWRDERPELPSRKAAGAEQRPEVTPRHGYGSQGDTEHDSSLSAMAVGAGAGLMTAYGLSRSAGSESTTGLGADGLRAYDSPVDSGPSINPANGLPMIRDSMIDVMGNPYGFDASLGLSDSGFDSTACHTGLSDMGSQDCFGTGMDSSYDCSSSWDSSSSWGSSSWD